MSKRRIMIIFVCALGVSHAACGPRNATTDGPEQVAGPACFAHAADLPTAWRPSGKVAATLPIRPWAVSEQIHANEAVKVGFQEMASFLEEHPEAIEGLWDNSVEAFVDIAYGGSNDPELTAASLQEALKNFLVLSRPFVAPNAGHHDCSESGTLLTLVVYGRTLAQRTGPNAELSTTQKSLVSKTNLAVAHCGGLAGLLGYDPEAKFATPSTSNSDVYDLVMWSITLGDALANPNLKLPDGSAEFIGDTWRYLDTYPLPNAATYSDGAHNGAFYDNAYLVTHAGYIPTGYGRYPLYRSDGEWLFVFLRANFYAVMEMRELDLLAEFVDLFRQYGCSEENDKQLRDGSRFLLRLYDKAGGSWMAHRESYEGQEISPYDLLHKPWTGMSGLRRRVVEAPEPGTYGGVVRDAFRRNVDE